MIPESVPKGFVKPSEKEVLRNKIETLLADKKGALLSNNTEAFYLQLLDKERLFTIAEQIDIESRYESYLRWKNKKGK